MRSCAKFILLFPLLALAGCATNPVSGKQEIRLFSDSDEITLGQQTKESILKEYGEYKDPALKQYVESVGMKLVQVSERRNLPYNFTVLDTTVINAFAAPGGCVFVTKGALKAMDTESELAAVLGHEIGHVSSRHSMGALEKQYGYEIMFNLASALTKKDLTTLKQYSDSLAGLIFLGFGRENEFQADNCGVRYAVAAGYDGMGEVAFFKKLQALQGREMTNLEMLFSTHPPTSDRIGRVKSYLASVNYQVPANPPDDFKARTRSVQ